MTAGRTLAQTLAELADLSDLRGAAAAAADLRQAAEAVRAMSLAEAAQLTDRTWRKRLAGEPPLAPRLPWSLQELSQGSGALALHRALAGLPFLLRRLIQLETVTTAQALVLVRQANVLTLRDLQGAVEAGRVSSLLGAPTGARLQRAAEALGIELRPVSLGRAWELLEGAIDRIAAACPTVDDLVIAGDARRTEPLVASPSLVGRAPDPASALDTMASRAGFDDVLHRGPRRAIVVSQGTEIDVRIAAADEYGTTLFRATGNPWHVAAVERRRASARVAAREEDVYAHAGLSFIPPELRLATGEIDAAAARALPRLVTREEIRGDLHMHSTYSDGRDTLGAMIAACQALGYEYIAIADHSERAGASRTVTRDQLARQRDEIASLRERYPNLAILHGIEVDIMPDGRLDFPDAVLASLDIVLASLHDAAGQDGRRLTARAVQAMRHPLVNILTHPGNRIVGRRAPFPLDYPTIFAEAARTGTALEIDGAPVHLDLDGEGARAAVHAGATLVIDSDAHRAGRLDRHMRFGVGTARRGWVEPRHVLNTRPLGEVRRFIEAKRRG